MSTMNVSALINRISAVVRVDHTAVLADAVEAIRSALMLAYTYKGHRCNKDALIRALQKIEGIKSAKSRALQPVLAHYIAQSDVIRNGAKAGETVDVNALVDEGVTYFEGTWTQFEAQQAEKSAQSVAKSKATREAKAQEAVKVQEAAKAEAVSLAETVAKLQAQVAALTEENAKLRAQLEKRKVA